MNIIVVGAGMIGKERIKALKTLGENIVAVIDPINIPSKLSDWTYLQYSDLQTYFEHQTTSIDWIFICTPHDKTCDYIKFALEYGCDVLAEKPIGRDLKEYYNLNWSAVDKVNVGFNYRFFKGVNQLLLDCKNKLFGDLIFVNMILALGDAPGSEKTWRLDPEKAGRGALLDPGIHLIDLAMLISDDRLYSGQIKTWKGFWDTGLNEEEIHFLANDKNGVIYNIQSSICRWRNTFRIEINGTEGYGIVEGRNRHYGNQTYRRGKRWGWQGGKSQRESEELVIDYDGEDSFLEETRAVLYGCEGIQPATHEDNRRCLEFIESL
jgi:predicted dehydrogenase